MFKTSPYELLAACTVRVESRLGIGTGFFVSPHQILTCRHVIGDLAAADLILWSDTPIQVIKLSRPKDPSIDLAMLEVEPQSRTLLSLEERQDIRPRDPFFSFGYNATWREGDSLTGSIEGWAQADQSLGNRMIKLKEAQVRPGFSGAPLYNERTRRICGVIRRTQHADFALGGWAVPTSLIAICFDGASQSSPALSIAGNMPIDAIPLGIATSNDGKYAASFSSDSSLSVVAIEDFRQQAIRLGTTPASLTFSWDSRSLLFCNDFVYKLSLDGNCLTPEKIDHRVSALAIASVPKGVVISRSGRDGGISIWDTSLRRRRCSRHLPDPCPLLAVNGHGDLIAAANHKECFVIRSSDLEIVARYSNRGIASLTFLNSGRRRLIIGTMQGDVLDWRINSGQPQVTGGGSGPVLSVAGYTQPNRIDSPTLLFSNSNEKVAILHPDSTSHERQYLSPLVSLVRNDMAIVAHCAGFSKIEL